MHSVKIAFIGIIPMLPRFKQSDYNIKFGEVIAFGYIKRLFVKVVLLLVFQKKCFVFCPLLPLLLRIKSVFHSVSSCFKPI